MTQPDELAERLCAEWMSRETGRRRRSQPAASTRKREKHNGPRGIISQFAASGARRPPYYQCKLLLRGRDRPSPWKLHSVARLSSPPNCTPRLCRALSIFAELPRVYVQKRCSIKCSRLRSFDCAPHSAGYTDEISAMGNNCLGERLYALFPLENIQLVTL